MKIIPVRQAICLAAGTAGGFIASLLGGFDAGMATLTIFMCVDFALGLIAAAVFGVSTKSEGGALESRACFKGLCRKFAVFAVIIMACRLDLLLGADYIRDAVIICYLVNETLSIVENLALIGVPVPEAVKNALEIMRNNKQ